MAEGVGLSLAILGLAGNLKGCLDMFTLFCSARDLGRDYSIVSSKFDIEKALLLKWAERVRILQPDYDRRLDDETTLDAVEGILASIKFLLEDGAALQRRYGLEQVDAPPDSGQGVTGGSATVASPEDAISSAMMQRFTNDFQSLCIRAKTTQSTTTVKRRFMWAIGHKEKFEKLVADLAHFVSKLDQVLPDRGGLSSGGHLSDDIARKIYQLMSESSRHAYHNAVLSETISARRPVARITERTQLGLVRDVSREDAGSKLLSDLADRVLIQKSESIILEAVWFRGLQERRDLIEPAHLQTLGWVLDPTPGTAVWDDLPTWLGSGDGVYWVSGKAGSGKSTLMKHIHSHSKTTALLKQWAGESSLLVGSFFFWGLGSPEQKTQRGLSRSLLYHIIERYPYLTPKLLPWIWREVYAKHEGHSLLNLDPPTDADLAGAFAVLPSILAANSIKLCLFIDGLDEYEGNCRDGIRLILRLGQTPNIKIVVSSRPEPACVSAFSALPKLRVQDLNRQDIQQYVESTIGCHPYIERLRETDDAGCTELLADLTDRASGVFLWIILACRSLLEGFESTDRIRELRARLEELPRELLDMFQHMLNKVPKGYHDQTAKLLRLAYRCQLAPWPMADPHNAGMPALTLSIMERVDFCVEKAEFERMSTAEKKIACDEIDGRLRSRTGGLLELCHIPLEPCFCGHLDVMCRSAKDPVAFKVDCTVRFMHRTVFEFLHDPSVWARLDALQFPAGDQFDPESVLAAMSLARAHFTHWRDQGYKAVKQTLMFFRNLDGLSSTQAVIRNGDRLSQLLRRWITPSSAYPSSSILQAVGCPSALTHAAEVGMTKFLDHKLREKGQTPAQQQANVDLPLLYYALMQPFVAENAKKSVHVASIPPSSSTVSYLLEAGYNRVQEPFINPSDGESRTLWELWLDRIDTIRPIEISTESWEITMKMIDHGADPEVLWRHRSSLSIRLVDRINVYENKYAGEELPDEYHRLREILDKRQYRSLSDSTVEEQSEDDNTMPKRRSEDGDIGYKRRRSGDDSEGVSGLGLAPREDSAMRTSKRTRTRPSVVPFEYLPSLPHARAARD